MDIARLINIRIYLYKSHLKPTQTVKCILKCIYPKWLSQTKTSYYSHTTEWMFCYAPCWSHDQGH